MLLNPFQRAIERVHGIPVMFGRFPVVGNLPAFLTDPVGLQRRAAEALGPLFWIDLGVGHSLDLTVSGEEAFGLFKSPRVESSHFFEQLELFFGRSLIVTDGSSHRHVRSILNRPFSPSGLQRVGVASLARDALAAYAGIEQIRRAPYYQRRLARARAMLAHLLAPTDRAAAAALATDALTWYRAVGGYEAVVTALAPLTAASR